MSQHWFTTKENRKVLYGLDKPTGGYFFTEFWNDEEIVNDDDVKESESALLLSKLKKIFVEKYNKYLTGFEIQMLMNEWKTSENPTPMQFQVNKMFGKDLNNMLWNVQEDLSFNPDLLVY
jgi:hypothetical protein